MKGHHPETKKEKLVLKTASLFYKHLLRFHQEEVYAVARNADFLFPGEPRDSRELKNAIQRHLYHLSKSLGWRRFQRPGKNPATGKRWPIGPWVHDTYNPVEKYDPETGEVFTNPAIVHQFILEKYRDEIRLMDNSEFVGQCIRIVAKELPDEFNGFIQWLFEDNNPGDPKPRPEKAIMLLRERFRKE